MSEPIMNVTGADIIKLMNYTHKYGQTTCKVCGQPTGNCVAVYIVHATEVCNCDEAPYEHLIIVPYHVECFATIAENRGKEARDYKAELAVLIANRRRLGRPRKGKP